MKTGRPPTDKPRERLQMVSFRVDEETLQAIVELEAAVAGGVVTRRRRSIALRRAVLEARDRLRAALASDRKL